MGTGRGKQNMGTRGQERRRAASACIVAAGAVVLGILSLSAGSTSQGLPEDETYVFQGDRAAAMRFFGDGTAILSNTQSYELKEQDGRQHMQVFFSDGSAVSYLIDQRGNGIYDLCVEGTEEYGPDADDSITMQLELSGEPDAFQQIDRDESASYYVDGTDDTVLTLTGDGKYVMSSYQSYRIQGGKLWLGQQSYQIERNDNDDIVRLICDDSEDLVFVSED